MRIFFIHQHFPAQFIHLARHLAGRPGHEVIAITKRRDAPVPGVKRVFYQIEDFEPARNPMVRAFDRYTRHGMAVRKALFELERRKILPDIIVVHPGWGEALYVQDVFPHVPRVDYCELLVSPEIRSFDPEETSERDIEAEELQHQRTAMLLFCLEKCTAGWSPTVWQQQSFPSPYHGKIRVVPDGVDTEKAKPDASARLELADGQVLAPGDEVVTWAARNLEPARGIRPFFRAAAKILDRRPQCQIVVAGGDEKGYGQRHSSGRSYREIMLEQIPLDPARCHFLGRVDYDRFLRLLQVSRVHLYLSAPYVLSWSMLEAMACGASLVASDTAPVREVIADSENGLLADFFSADDIADRIEQLLDDAPLRERIAGNARRTIEQRFALSHSLERQVDWFEELIAGRC